MRAVINLPFIGQEIKIRKTGDPKHIILQDSNGFAICDLDLHASYESIANHLIRIVKDAQERGYEQALADIRRTLGLS
jgi:hypothetical protein